MSIQSDGQIFRVLIDQLPDGVFILVEETFVYLNQSVLTLLGYGAESAVARLKLADIVHPDDLDRARDTAAKRSVGKAMGQATYRLVRSDRSLVEAEVHATDIQIRGRRGTYGVIRDISSRRKMEERLQRLEHTNLVSRLASGIAHDLNNTLAVILSNADVAASSRSARRDPEVVAAMQRVRVAVERGSQQVRHIHQMGAAHADPVERQPLWLNPLVEDVLDLTRARWGDEADSRGVSFDVRWEPADVPPVLGHETELRAALVALVFNALEAMPTGGTVTLETFADPSGRAGVRVRDTGEGIDPDHIPRLADAFFTTRDGKDMGFGLALVHSVVASHGGRLDVDSTPGEGAVFTLSLPSSDRPPEHSAPPPRSDLLTRSSSPTVPDAPDRPKTRGGRSVLLIDDQADLLQVVRDILERRGYCVDMATNGKEGLALARVSKYSVVLTDLGMPDISGWEVADQIRELSPTTPIVLMTGWAADIEPERLEHSAVQALLAKPFRSEELLQLVERILHEKEQRKRDQLSRPL